jgi:hypothetical protein
LGGGGRDIKLKILFPALLLGKDPLVPVLWKAGEGATLDIVANTKQLFVLENDFLFFHP